MQVLTIQVLLHQVQKPCGLVGAGVEHLDDVFAVDRARSPRLAPEAASGVAARLEEVTMDDLDGDALVAAKLLRLINGAHPPLSKQADKFVLLSDRLANQEDLVYRSPTWPSNEQA